MQLLFLLSSSMLFAGFLVAVSTSATPPVATPRSVAARQNGYFNYDWCSSNTVHCLYLQGQADREVVVSGSFADDGQGTFAFDSSSYGQVAPRNGVSGPKIQITFDNDNIYLRKNGYPGQIDIAAEVDYNGGRVGVDDRNSYAEAHNVPGGDVHVNVTYGRRYAYAYPASAAGVQKEQDARPAAAEADASQS